MAAAYPMALRAQHAADNPVVSADDAFGETVGMESTGIYNPGGVRGFNPQVAGNARVDSLYFDQQGQLTERSVEGSTIRVGLAAIDFAFPAPTGIVDYDLRHANDGHAAATLIASVGPFDNKGLSIDGSVPLLSKELQLPFGVNVQRGAPNNFGPNIGYTSNITNVGAVPQWKPNDRITVRALFDWQDMSDSRTQPVVFTQGNYLPPRIQRGFLGQYWALNHFLSQNFGALIDAKLSDHWSLAAGLFRSNSDTPLSYADLYVNTLPDGSADHLLVASRDQDIGSTSGEVRATGHFEHRGGYQNIILMVRGRDTLAHYGGSAVIDAGEASIASGAQVPEPNFTFSALTADLTKLWSVGAAYQVRQAGVGELSLGVQKEHYDKTVTDPGQLPSTLSDDPWRLYGNASVPIGKHLVTFASYTQGFEDSGAVPKSAANREAILPTTRSWQVDAGLRYKLTSKVTLIAGVFQLDKPYFNFDTNNVDRQLGEQRARGLELSLTGELAPGLSINGGALFGKVVVLGTDLAAQGVGPVALGQPRNQYSINLDYTIPKLPALSVDMNLYHFGDVPGLVNDGAYVPAITMLGLGERFRFKLWGADSTLRVQVQNLNNAYIWNIGTSPGYVQFAPRSVNGYLTVDIG